MGKVGEQNMPRPQKAGIDYFPLDVNFFSDPKIKILKARYGPDGITVYLYLLCEIYRAGYFIQFNDDSIFITSDDLNMSAEKVKQVLNFLLERSLFNHILFQSDKVLTSAGIQKRFQLAVKERAKKNPVQIKCFWLLSEEETEPFIKVSLTLNNSRNKAYNSEKNSDKSMEESPKESKGKESKVEESKEHRDCETVTYVSDEKLNVAILNFMKHRIGIKKPMIDSAVLLMIEKLDKMTSNQNEKIEILNQSIINGWQGIFPLKAYQQNQPSMPGKEKPNKFHNFEQRDTNYDAMVLERLNERLGGEDESSI